MNELENINNSYNKITTLYDIKSKFILKKIFDNLQYINLLKIINKNKKFQNKLSRDINDYKKYLQTEIEIIPTKEIFGDSIHKYINHTYDKFRAYYHIYLDESKEEIKTNTISNDKPFIKIKLIIDYEIKSFESLFRGCRGLKKMKFIKFNRRDIENMSYMFNECISLEELIFSKININNVKNMTSMFSGCILLKELDLSNFNTNNVTDMYDMFSECYQLEKLNVSSFNTEKVSKMNFMFHKCSSLKELNLSNFNTNNVISMYYMFYGCSSLTELNISNFSINNIKDMSYMFYGCNSLTKFYCSNNMIKEQYEKMLQS